MTMNMADFEHFWDRYNSEDSYLPFYIPGVFWVATYLYAKLSPNVEYSKWGKLLAFHHGGAMILATLSIQRYINERIPILFSVGYFICDTVDCIERRDGMYFLHAIVSLTLQLLGYVNPTIRELRMVSKSFYSEISTPFMHLAKKTRNPWHFVLFWFMFTCCRMIWWPCMYIEIVERLPFTHPIPILMIVFYALNSWWYYKIVRILVQNAYSKDEHSTEQKTE